MPIAAAKVTAAAAATAEVVVVAVVSSGGGSSRPKRLPRMSACSNVTDMAVRSLPLLQQVARPPRSARTSGCAVKWMS